MAAPKCNDRPRPAQPPEPKMPTASEWDRFLRPGAPDEVDHDREAEAL
jgi:hypothetical protein